MRRLTDAERQDLEHWPLRYLNAVAIPLAIALALFTQSYLRALLIGAPIGFVVAGAMAGFWIGRFRRLIDESDNAMIEFRAMQEAPQSRDPRFIFWQAMSGALIQTMWTSIAFGVRWLL